MHDVSGLCKIFARAPALMSSLRYGSSVSEKDLEEIMAEVRYFCRVSHPFVLCVAFFGAH
jgi:hypothetical protein